jgi:hypothetical protein
MCCMGSRKTWIYRYVGSRNTWESGESRMTWVYSLSRSLKGDLSLIYFVESRRFSFRGRKTKVFFVVIEPACLYYSPCGKSPVDPLCTILNIVCYSLLMPRLHATCAVAGVGSTGKMRNRHFFIALWWYFTFWKDRICHASSRSEKISHNHRIYSKEAETF